MNTFEQNIIKIMKESGCEYIGYKFINYKLAGGRIKDSTLINVLHRLVENNIIEMSNSITCWDNYFVIRDFVYKLKEQ